MATDIKIIIATLNKIDQQCAELLAPDTSQKLTREVLSNLVLANGVTLRKIVDEIIFGQRQIDINDFPEAHAAFDKIYRIGAEAKKQITSVPASKKAELEKMLSAITKAVTIIDKEADIIHTSLIQLSTQSAELSAEDSDNPNLKKNLAATSADERLVPVWDDNEDKLLSMACCSNQEWGLLYKVNQTKHVAFFAHAATEALILEWCAAKKREVREQAFVFEAIAIINPMGTRTW
jgi:hypothetical protein